MAAVLGLSACAREASTAARAPIAASATVSQTQKPADIPALKDATDARDEPPGHWLLDLLVWGRDPIAASSYDSDLQAEIAQHQRRHRAYAPTRPKVDDGLAGMGTHALDRYERLLAAVSALPGTDELARAYVAELKPCYEWEGYSECPEREARFAAAYRESHPSGPLSDYLPLLEAHRWLCGAEGWNYRDSPADAAPSRAAYQRALAVAFQSPSRMIRTAAAELRDRDRCRF
jgi:hypothetical protein